MRPLQPPQGTAGASRSGRRRQNLTLPVPRREPTSLAVPLPLPPSSNAAPPSTSHQNANNSGSPAYPLDFSHLERVNRIGSGAGGTVYKVIHRPSSRLYALKVMHGHHEESVRDQILREIKILRDVDDPNVVKCHDIYNHNGEIQVLLELMDGGSLEGLHIPNERELSNLTYQILSGIAYLHRRKIVHRDIKPSNLLVNSRRKVKIADFGVSRVLAQTMDPCNSSVGTIAYMSPERINTDLNHGKYDGHAGDIWSFGVSILEFYLGRFPFAVGRQGDWASLMCAICMAEPPEAPLTASKEFREFISCCLQREPARRWTATQLLRHPFILQHNQVPHQNLQQLLPPPRPLSS
ncbi:mitogen-activated protein kinase kinase 5-like [Punica granatum]|uniref:mitogen-activated protein kinase kinase n=2 Tax=Punica granatum TaxID=22663 RepID=A0A218WAM0_PUNGR|nr:mitogen-activated protein kinase kinase 5-like [Punica granatum]OWM69539.1 hypothetical protein CDL15_Pgr014000 [Punica granatum]PKI40777.1 hypothetical protein CRG98_038788 [Punica granatum]